MTELKLVEPELQDVREVYSQRITLGDVLGEKSSEEDPLGLKAEEADMRVYKSDDPGFEDTLIYRVSFPDTSFSGQDFSALLGGARHEIDFIGGRIGILADWMLPELKDDISVKRTERHKQAFDPFWSEFLKYHNPQFMHTISSMTIKDMEGLFDTITFHLWTFVDKIKSEGFGSGYTKPEFLFDNYHLLESSPLTALSGITKEDLKGKDKYLNALKLMKGLPRELTTCKH